MIFNIIFYCKKRKLQLLKLSPVLSTHRVRMATGSVSCGSLTDLSISVDHLFQRLFEHLVASGVDEWIQTRVDKTNHPEQIQINAFR